MSGGVTDKRAGWVGFAGLGVKLAMGIRQMPPGRWNRHEWVLLVQVGWVGYGCRQEGEMWA